MSADAPAASTFISHLCSSQAVKGKTPPAALSSSATNRHFFLLGRKFLAGGVISWNGLFVSFWLLGCLFIPCLFILLIQSMQYLQSKELFFEPNWDHYFQIDQQAKLIMFSLFVIAHPWQIFRAVFWRKHNSRWDTLHFNHFHFHKCCHFWRYEYWNMRIRNWELILISMSCHCIVCPCGWD